MQSCNASVDNTLANENASSDNWQWNDKTKVVWESADEEWQTFCAGWHGAPASEIKSSFLSLDPLPALISSFPPSIFVRESYRLMFDYIWARAMTSKGEIGTIITGQPGTGKTLFQFYLLVRLLQARWLVDFKSHWVSQNVLQGLRDAQEDEILSQIQGIPQAGSLRKWYFELLVHCRMSRGDAGCWPVNVRYVLVVPQGEPDRKWQFP